MKIFVAYGFNKRDTWIPTLVFPIIEAFGAEPVAGEMTYGGSVPTAIRELIHRSDALIGFTTRRSRLARTGLWTTHHWVLQEISTAVALKRPALEVRETGLDPQLGMTSELQRITYSEPEREKTLVKLVQAIGRWRLGSVRLQLLPDQLAKIVQPLLETPGFRCTYRILDGALPSPEFEAKPVRITGGLLLTANGIPRHSKIQVSIQAAGKKWSSPFQTVDAAAVQLEEEATPNAFPA